MGKIDWADLIARIEKMIEKEEEFIQLLKESKAGMDKIEQSEYYLNHYKERLEQYKKQL